MGVYSIGQLAKRFGLSRSTLLYYDAVGLLRASARSEAKYRLFSDRDVQRLEEVCRYRRMGVPIKDIKKILAGDDKAPLRLLRERQAEIDRQVEQLSTQRAVIVRLISGASLGEPRTRMTKEKWVRLLVAAGLDEEGMGRWHAEFERMSPDLHRAFLESLDIPHDEVERIRRRSRRPNLNQCR